jgi:hypothetical protein
MNTFNANSTKQNKRERKTWIKEEIEIIKEKEGKQEWTVDENRKRSVKEEKKNQRKNSRQEGNMKREGACI